MDIEMLTIAAVKTAQPASAPYKMFDGGGLFLYVAPTGLKSWRLKYRVKGREKLLTFGRFPEVSLQQARLAREEAKETMRRGVDPAVRSVASNSFEELARAWHRHGTAGWSIVHADEVLASLERDVLPMIGGKAPDAISAVECLAILRTVENRGCITSARRLRHRLSSIFRFGMAQGLASSDPAESLRAAMKPLPLVKPMPALTTIADCRALLSCCDALSTRETTLLASRFLSLTAVRLEALRGMRWSEVDFDARAWTVPAARMKLGRAKKGEERFAHTVPLSAPALQILESLRQPDECVSSTGIDQFDNRLVFPGRGGQSPIGEGSLRELYIRAGYRGRHVPHGWRASFSTIMNETMGREWRDDIDQALAHVNRNLVEAAYNRAQLLDRRRALFDRWGELLTSA